MTSRVIYGKSRLNIEIQDAVDPDSFMVVKCFFTDTMI